MHIRSVSVGPRALIVDMKLLWVVVAPGNYVIMLVILVTYTHMQTMSFSFSHLSSLYFLLRFHLSLISYRSFYYATLHRMATVELTKQKLGKSSKFMIRVWV